MSNFMSEKSSNNLNSFLSFYLHYLYLGNVLLNQQLHTVVHLLFSIYPSG